MQSNPQEELTNRYNREASAYRDLWAPVLRLAGLKLLRELAGGRAERIIDVGTGVGSMSPHLQMTFPGAFVLGVDRSPGMLALGPAGIPRAVMDATQLGIAHASADRVLLVCMLFHLERPVDGLREGRRVLRNGGRLGTVTWAEELQSSASRIWTECLDAHGAAEGDSTIEARHELVNTPEKMEKLLRLAGFTSARCWQDELVTSIDLDRLIRLKTSLGAAKRRFDNLAAGAREACVAAARRQMEALEPEGFIARGRVVYAVATV